MSAFYVDLDRMLARLDADMAEVEYWDAIEPDWRDLSREPEAREVVSAWDMSPRAAADEWCFA